MECPNTNGCPMYARFKTDTLKNVYIKMYCKGNYENCKRKQLKDSGETVPDTLLPDGKDLSEL